MTLATTGGEAVSKILGGDSYDAILCDLHMPHMSGIEVHQRLLDAAPDAAARMIFLSGGAITKAAQDFARAERHRVLEKPIAPEVLTARLAALSSETVAS